MEFVLSFLLLALNLISFQFGINQYIFLFASTAIFSGLFWTCFRKSKSFLAACLMMFCHTWQISWMNILGTSTEYLQLPWFYLVGVLCVMYVLFHFNVVLKKDLNAFFLVTFICLIIISFFPLINSPSITEGLKEFIMIIFFLVMVFIGFLFQDSISSENREHVLNAYTFAVFISSVFLILQYMAYTQLGLRLFNFELGVYLDNETASASLLMGDTSCATIMLGSAVFICISRIEKKKNVVFNSVCIILTVIGMALTTRRTSIVSLIIILALYSLFHYKNPLAKIASIVLFAIVGAIMIYYLLISRPVDDLSQYLYDNERFANYVRVLEVSETHPFGVGYDGVYSNSFMSDNIAPHNTALRWLLMGGYWLVIPMIIIIARVVTRAFKKNLSAEYWILIYAIFASNFIPDLLSTRFFVIPCMCAFLFMKSEKTKAV